MAKPAPKASSRTSIPGHRAEDRSPEKREHRDFPRLPIRTKFSISVPDGEESRFQASLTSENLSVSGVFLESTFFLSVNQELHVEFALPEDGSVVRGRGIVVREERADGPKGRSGFALRFTEFFDQTEVALAKIFLGERLREFSASYLKSRRAKNISSELDRLTDALAAWELLKITADHDVWIE